MSISLSERDTAPVSGSSLHGHLQLRSDVRADGSSFISRQSFRAPIHIGKGHVDREHLVLNISNPTAGFFDGDRVDAEIIVGRGSRLVLGTPAASRVYQTRSGNPAANSQTFRVEEHASLEWFPEPFIPHAGARYEQITEIDLQESSSLLFFEWLAPGRVAMGEVFAYQNLRWALDLRIGGVLLARERYDLQCDHHSLEALRVRFPAAHFLSVYAAGIMTRQWPAAELDTYSDNDVLLGHGAIQGGVHVIRALCRDGLATRCLQQKLRKLLYSHAGLVPPSLGRIFC